MSWRARFRRCTQNWLPTPAQRHTSRTRLHRHELRRARPATRTERPHCPCGPPRAARRQRARRPAHRRLPLAARQAPPRGAGAPARRRRARAGLAGPPSRDHAGPVRRDARPHPGGRRGAAPSQEWPLVLEPHAPRCAIPGVGAPQGQPRRARAGDARREPAGPRQAVPRTRRHGREPGRALAGVLGRRDRCARLHAARARPHHRPRPALAHRADRRHRVGQRQPDAVLPEPGRRTAHAPAVAPPARRQQARRTAARGTRRALLARPVEDRRRTLRGAEHGQSGLQRRSRDRRRPAGRHAAPRAATAAGHRDRARAPARPLLSARQRPRPQLQTGRDLGRDALARRCGRADRAPARRDARRLGSVCRPHGHQRARARRAKAARVGFRQRRVAPHRAARASVFGQQRRQRRVRHNGVSARLQLAGVPGNDLRLRHGPAYAHTAQAPAGSGRLRPGPIPGRATHGARARRHAGAGVAGLPPRPAPGRRAALAAVRLRRLR